MKELGSISIREGGAVPAGFTGEKFTVVGTEIGSRSGTLATAGHGGTGHTDVMFFSGGSGTGWWGSGEAIDAFFAGLVDDGFVVTMVKWASPGWSVGTAGPQELAARPATVMAEMVSDLGTGPLIVVGGSGGCSQIAYSLAYYGVRPTRAVVSSGPPHYDLGKACLDPQWDVGKGRKFLDASYGFAAQTGPCWNRNGGWSPTPWLGDSVRSGPDWNLETEVNIVEGSKDYCLPQATAYYNQLGNGGTNVTWTLLPGVGHGVHRSAAGLAAIDKAIRAPL